MMHPGILFCALFTLVYLIFTTHSLTHQWVPISDYGKYSPCMYSIPMFVFLCVFTFIIGIFYKKMFSHSFMQYILNQLLFLMNSANPGMEGLVRIYNIDTCLNSITVSEGKIGITKKSQNDSPYI